MTGDSDTPPLRGFLIECDAAVTISEQFRCAEIVQRKQNTREIINIEIKANNNLIRL